MAEFTVTVEGRDYDVTAPDERTAWRWANVEHGKLAKPKKPDAVDRAMVEVRDLQSTTGPELLAGSAPVRFALGAAAPFLGAAQLAANAIGGPIAKGVNADLSQLEEMKQKGMRAYGQGGTDWIGTGGTVMSPPSLAMMGAPLAAGMGGRMAQGSAMGAGFGAATPVTEQGNFLANKATQIGTGAAIGGAIPGFLSGAGSIYRGARNLIDPMLGKAGTERAAARGAAEAIGNRMPAVRQELANPRTIVPGSMPTAAEAAVPAGSTELAGLQRLAAQKVDPSGYRDIAKAQEAARLAQIESIGQTPQALEAAQAARATAGAQDYGAAFSQAIKADPQLMQLAQNPYFKNALPTAMDLAKANGVNPKTNLTEFLHYVKLELDAQLGGAGKTAISRSEERAVGNTKDQLVQWLAKANPAYDTARGNFAAASRPINEMQVGQELASTLRQPTELGERVSSFAGAMRDAPKVIKRATGNARYQSLDEVLTPQNVQKVDDVLADMLRKGEFEQMASKGLPKAQSIMQGAVPELPPTGIFKPILSAARSWVNRLAGKMDDEALEVLSESLKTPAGLSALLDKLPSPTRRAFLEQMMSVGERGAVIGATDVASDQQK